MVTYFNRTRLAVERKVQDIYIAGCREDAAGLPVCQAV